MKRSGIKRGTKPLKRTTEIRRESDKQRAFNRAWRKVKASTLERDEFICQAAHLVPQVRCGGGLESHHKKKRSTAPWARLDPDNIVTVCSEHHAWIDINQLEAHGVGLHRPSWEYKATG
jgi:hypothetical protein